MKNGGLLLWNAIAICEMSKTYWQMGKTPHERRFGEPFKRTNDSLWSNRGVSPDFNTRPVKTSPRIWKGDILITDIEEMEEMDASEIYPRRINAKEVLIPQKGEEIIFPTADCTAKLTERDHELREPTPRREQPVRSEDLSGKLQGEREGFEPTETRDDAEARKDFGSIQGDFIYRHHSAPRVQLHVAEEETFLIPVKYIDVTRSTHTDLDVMQEKRIGNYWNVDANRSLSDSWKGFTKFTLLKEHPSPSPSPLPLPPPKRDMCGPKYGPTLGVPLRREKNKNGQTKSQNSMMLDQ